MASTARPYISIKNLHCTCLLFTIFQRQIYFKWSQDPAWYTYTHLDKNQHGTCLNAETKQFQGNQDALGHPHRPCQAQPWRVQQVPVIMISRQFLLSSTRSSHPNHKDIQEAPKRLMRNTLASKFKDEVLPFTADGITDEPNYRADHPQQWRQGLHREDRQQQSPEWHRTEHQHHWNRPAKENKDNSGTTQVRIQYLPAILPDENKPHWTHWQLPRLRPHHSTPFSMPRETNRTLWEDLPAAATFLGLPTFQGPRELDDND